MSAVGWVDRLLFDFSSVQRIFCASQDFSREMSYSQDDWYEHHKVQCQGYDQEFQGHDEYVIG
jgi:hypothetical protein